MARFVPIIIQVKEGTSEQTVRELTNAFKKLDREVQSTSRSASGLSFASLSGAFALGNLASNAFSRLTDVLGQGVRALLDYSSNLENTKIAFTTMMGSADLANKHLQELQQFALKTPFQFGELINASQRMQALGFSSTQVIPILKDVGNAVAAAGGGSERLDRVVLALSQIQSKGKVATQELNQLAESGISGWKILEAQLGKSRSALVDMVEKGEISSKVFLDAFQKFSQQNFGGLMEAQSKTFAGAMSNIKDALLQTSAVAFEPLYKRLSETAQQIGELSTTSKQFKDDMAGVGQFFATVWDGAIEAIYIVKDAYRLVASAIVGQVVALIEVFGALAQAAKAAYHALAAVAAAMRGDFVEASKQASANQKALEGSTDSLRRALEAQGSAVRELGTIWTEAGNRSAEAQGKMAASAQMFWANAARSRAMAGPPGQSPISAQTSVAPFSFTGPGGFTLKAPPSTPGSYDSPVSTAKAAGAKKAEFTSDQLRFARQIVETGFGLGANERQILSALAAALVESKVQNLRGGDRDSRGIFQQRPSQGWGTVAQILNPEFAIQSFFQGIGTNAGVLGVSQAGTIGQMAQRVQRSAFPGRYDQSLGKANRLFDLAVAEGVKYKPDKVEAIPRPTKLTGTDIDPNFAALFSEDEHRRREMYFKAAEQRADAAHKRRMDREAEYSATFRNMMTEITHLEIDLDHLRKQNSDNQFVDQRRLLMAKGEERDLLQRVAQVQDEIATGPYNESLRIQLALLEDIANMRRRDEQAIMAQNRAQLELADAEIFHSEQARAIVLTHLSQTQTQTQIFAGAITDAYDAVNDVVLRGVQRITGGIRGLDNLIAGLISRLTNRLFQKLLDVLIPGGGGGQAAGAGGRSGGGFFGNLIGNIFGGGGGGGRGTTGGFAGGSGAANILIGSGGSGAAGILGNGGGISQFLSPATRALLGGGISAPAALSLQAGPSSLAAIGQQFSTGAVSGAASGVAGGGLFAGLGASLGSMAPLLGLGLGAGLGGRLGGPSRVGGIMGMVGGGILGGAAGLLGGGALLTAITGVGAFSSFGALSAFAPLLGALPFLAPIAAALLIGSYIIGRNAQRRKEETQRNQWGTDALQNVYKILWAAKRGDLTVSEARSQWDEVHSLYMQHVSTLKDAKTRRHATLWWNNDVTPIWPQIEAAAKAGEVAKEVERGLIPEFSGGLRRGLVPFRGGMQTLIKVRPGERIDDVGLMKSWVVPGIDRGRDSVLTAATPNSRVLTRAQQSRIPGFAHGSSDGGSLFSPAPIVIEEANVYIDAEGIVKVGLKARGNREIQIKNVRSAILNKEL